MRTQNLTRNGFVDMFGRKQVGDRVMSNFEQIRKEVGLESHREEVALFNANNRWKKQGWSITPFKYRWANDFVMGSLTIRIGRFDGTVWVSNWGVEMGQGVHTRLAQVIARM